MIYQQTTSLNKLLKLRRRIRGIGGGASAGKTIGILQILIDQAQTNKGKLISVTSESMPHLKRGAMRDFLNILQGHNYFESKSWNKSDFTYNFKNGSQIEFFSLDMPHKVRGPRRDILFINEANNIPLETFEQLETRTRGAIWLDWNPTNEFWWYTDILNNRNFQPVIDFLKLTYKDNEALGEQEIASIERRKDNKNWWKVYGLGELGEVESRIYTGWRIIDEIPHEARLERRGLDFGYSNDPSAIVEVYYYNGGWIINEILYQKGLSNKRLADFLSNLERPHTTVIADSAEPKSIDEIRSYGINIMPSHKGKRTKSDINPDIQLVQDQPISITKTSINTIKEYRNYLWMTDKNGKILNEPDPNCAEHGLDAVKYAMKTLGKLKQATDYWDRIFEEELNPIKANKFNKEC